MRTRSDAKPAISSGLSANIDAALAAEAAAEDAGAGLDGRAVDLVMAFVSGEHTEHAGSVAEAIRSTLDPGVLVGVSGAGVVGPEEELEGKAGVSILAASLPGVGLEPFRYRDLPHVPDRGATKEDLQAFADAIGAKDDLRAVLFIADPFSVPIATVINAVNALPGAIDSIPYAPIMGGMASGGKGPGDNALILDHKAFRSGGVGLTISGDINVDMFVSQGCRPVGAPLVVTEAKRNIIRGLAGRPAFTVLRELVASLPDDDRTLLSGGMFVGRVINEYRDRFGRGDFLVRGVIGVDQASGAIAVSDRVRVGQTIQFHLRDASTATEDLKLLLTAQELQGPALGAVLFTDSARGAKLFGRPNHDAELIAETLAPGGGTLPVAGVYAAGEIGPIGDQSFIHAHTACAAVFRARR